MNIDYLPIEFVALESQVDYVQSHGFGEYTSSCPRCGGSPHPTGELPDRFCMWPTSKATGGPLGWCRRCGYKWWPGKDDKDNEPTPEQLEQWKRNREEIQKELAEIRERKMQYLNSSEIHKTYAAALTRADYRRYLKRGISEDFVSYWSLGSAKDKIFFWKNLEINIDTLTIPIFELGFASVRNIKHRLIDGDTYGKYRYEVSKMTDYPFYTNHNAKAIDKIVVVEGEFKAMVTFICLNNPDIQVIGLPSKSPSEDCLNEIRAFDVPKWFILDPDAYEKTKNGTSAIQRLESLFPGEHFIDLPDKVDDMINRKSLDKEKLNRLMITARLSTSRKSCKK